MHFNWLNSHYQNDVSKFKICSTDVNIINLRGKYFLLKDENQLFSKKLTKI